MTAALNYFNRSIRNAIDNSMRVVNSSAPKTAEIPLQRLGFADLRKIISLNVAQKLVNSSQNLLVLSLPVQVVSLSWFGKSDFTYIFQAPRA